MKYRKGIFIVVYAIEKEKPAYLILKRKLHWKGWEFPKGGKRFFETEKRAVKRELKEETGLEILKIKKFDEKGKYDYPEVYKDRKEFKGQTYRLYAVQVKKEKVKIDKNEHLSYEWINFTNSIKKLTWKNQKKCLKIVDDWLNLKD
jgi:8-oxo-dGTP pyrophosphatase MutT (NUDIX family)